MPNYLPLFRPGDTVTFSVTTAVKAGEPVEVGTADRSVAPATAGSVKYVGVPGHDAAVGDLVTIEIGKPIHLLTAVGAAVTRGALLEVTAGGVRAGITAPKFVALTSAAEDAKVEALQL